MNVRIYSPSKTVTQSGRAKSGGWMLEQELESARLPEPLMGWASSADTNNQVKIRFSTLDEAIAHAEREGWTYTVLPAQERIVRARNYVDNFKYKAPAAQKTHAPVLNKDADKIARPAKTSSVVAKAKPVKAATAKKPVKKSTTKTAP